MSHPAPRLEDAVMTRRELLCRSGMGMGALALGGVLADAGLLTASARAALADGDAAGARLAMPGIAGASPLLPKRRPCEGGPSGSCICS